MKKEKNNPNPSPTGNRFGLFCFGASGDTELAACVKRNPNRSPAQRVRFGEEEQGSGRMASFFAAGIKRRRSKADFAPTMVRVTGLEPARLGHQNLNLARLPFRHTRGDTRLVYALRRVLSIRLQGAADKNRMRGFGRVWTAKEDKIYANSCTKPHYVVLY